MIRICKITKEIYHKDNYYIFEAFSGEHFSIIYTGDNPPKPLKTVEYQVHGEMTNNPRYGKQFKLESFKKVGKIKIYKPQPDYLNQ